MNQDLYIGMACYSTLHRPFYFLSGIGRFKVCHHIISDLCQILPVVNLIASASCLVSVALTRGPIERDLRIPDPEMEFGAAV